METCAAIAGGETEELTRASLLIRLLTDHLRAEEGEAEEGTRAYLLMRLLTDHLSLRLLTDYSSGRVVSSGPAR